MVLTLILLLIVTNIISFLIATRYAVKGGYVLGVQDEQVFMLMALKRALTEDQRKDVYEEYKKLDVELKVKGQLNA